MAFTLTSPAFPHGGTIPKPYTCDGGDVSPALRWTDPPSAVRSFALVVDDPDAPVGTWVHWILYDLAPGVREIPQGVEKKAETVLGGARQGMSWGVDRFTRVGYSGPCPPPGGPHRYFFRLYALDTVLRLRPRATKGDLLKAMSGHVLAQAELLGLYGR